MCCEFSESDRVASPGFPVDIVGVGKLHAAFLNESRTRGRWWRPVAGNPGRPLFSAHVRLGELGAPVRFPLALLRHEHPARFPLALPGMNTLRSLRNSDLNARPILWC